jgi:ferredoxin-NADP reductase/ferredoxin
MKVRFEPIGEEIDCAPDESVLDAAFRQGYNLAYGCREGQCSACKCFLIEGDAALKPYSNFALSDSEQSSGYSLMCRAMPEQDLVIELLHYDPDNYRLENPIRDGVAMVSGIEPLTDDMARVVLDAPGFSFTPGQFVDVHVDGAKRSFSMANADPGRIELIVRRYPGGRFSGKLDGQLKPGDEVGFTGPYGALRVRENARPILMLAAGSGIAPILSLLRRLEATACSRPVRLFFASRGPLCSEEIGELRLADFGVRTFQDRSLLDAVDEFLAAGELTEPDVYMCGPPPMLEAAEPMLIEKHKVDDQRIFQDKFTTAAEADPARTVGATAQTDDPAGAPTKRVGVAATPSGDEPERQFSWYTPQKRRATLYEDVTVDTQPSVHRHLRRGWPVSFEDGRGTWDDASTALRSGDWFEFRDPEEQWERPYYQMGTAVEHQIEGAMRSAREEGLIEDFAPEWVEFLRHFLQVPAYVEHGLWFALATAGRDCLSDSVSTCVCLQAAMKQRSAQALVLYAMDLEEHLEVEFPIATAREAFLCDEPWQPTRRLIERLAATADWGEVVLAANLVFEPIVATLIRRELGTRAAAANGDTVTPVLARVETQEWEWARAWTVALVRFLLNDARFGEDNRATISGWIRDWLPQALEAALALAPLANEISIGIDAGDATDRVRAYAGQMLEEARLPELCSLLGYEPAEVAVVAPSAARRRVRPSRERRVSARADDAVTTAPPPADADAAAAGSYDFVGIVMAKSAEGDAVAGILGKRHDIAVHEQPAFWDIRAKDRLVIPYTEVSEALGYEIDAYSIQHEMSTHYGRMVATDDALMLFSDPTEAMQHLMSA